jgi:hypothetical protein
MPTVPYQPYPTEQPTSRGASPIGVATPGEAFGTGIGQAMRGLGSQLEQSGNELFARAYAIKQLENETTAKDADVEVMTKLGQLKNDFYQLEGKNASAALPDYMERVKAIRQEALDGAPNPQARHMLDQSISRRVGFTIVDLGGHAGTQAKIAADKAAVARTDTEIATADITNDESFKHSRKAVQSETIAQAEHRGADDDTTREALRKNDSKLITTSIRKLAPNDPLKASGLFEKYKDQLDPNDREATQAVINRNMAIHGSRTVAQDILDGKTGIEPFDPTKGPGQMTRMLAEAKRLGESFGKDNPDFPDYLESRVRAQVNLGLAAYRDDQLQKKQTVESYVLGKSEKQRIVDLDGVAGPNAPAEIRDAFNGMNPDYQKSVRAMIGKEAKLTVPYTAERQARFNELLGMSQNEPAKFSELSLLNEDLPRGKIDQLMKRQIAISGHSHDDTKISTFMSYARPLLQTVGIRPDPSGGARAEEYNRFVGALEVRTQRYEQEFKKAPGATEVREMTRELLQQVITQKGRIWDTKERRFEVTVPEAHAEAIKRAYQDKLGREPNEEEIRMEYLGQAKLPVAQ